MVANFAPVSKPFTLASLEFFVDRVFLELVGKNRIVPKILKQT